MTRKECLEQAMGCVLRDRQKQYGEPEDCFETIAMMWSAYLGKIIQGWDVAAMMALLKIARIKANPAHADNWCDLAGYAACGAECRQKFEAEMKKTVEDAFETFPHLKPKAEGCEALVEKDAPQTPQELYQHIVDSNPATYKPRDPWDGLTRLNFKPPFELHKATGEELAEMAEEDGNG